MQDWCSPNLPLWREWTSDLAASGRPVRVLELGCWEGLSAAFWLQRLCAHPESELHLVDHFDSFESKAGRERYRKLSFNLHLGGSFEKVASDLQCPPAPSLLSHSSFL